MGMPGRLLVAFALIAASTAACAQDLLWTAEDHIQIAMSRSVGFGTTPASVDAFLVVDPNT
jgi:hypothetical protein